MFKVSDSNSKSNNFIELFPDFNLLTSPVEGLDDYPLNLLTDMSLMNTCYILIMIIIFNVFILIYLHDKEINKYLLPILDPKQI